MLVVLWVPICRLALAFLVNFHVLVAVVPLLAPNASVAISYTIVSPASTIHSTVLMIYTKWMANFASPKLPALRITTQTHHSRPAQLVVLPASISRLVTSHASTLAFLGSGWVSGWSAKIGQSSNRSPS